MPIDLVCLDADDTLWHNMRYFERSERALYDLLQPFAAMDVARERLERIEIRNLKRYGYGAKSFTLSMIETALELAGDDLPASVVARILDVGRDLLDHPVELLHGIRETLESLANEARLVLVTKGDLLHQEVKLAASGLGDLFTGVEIVSDKTADTFRRIFRRYGTHPAAALMAGDSMRSDVLPALEAGAWGVFIPQDGGWVHERADAPTDHALYRRIDALADLPALIRGLG